MSEVHGPELVRRYKANYGIPEHSPLTEEMVLQHWALERRLTNELLSSSPEHRWEVFERCYTTLYSELRWLNELSDPESEGPAADAARDWARLIGPAPKRVYEVGSGKGRLIAALADLGYDCTATEITPERGAKWTTGRKSVRWSVSDGVHLDRFEGPGSYDAVISDQVIEHLHPDDLPAHFASVHRIIKAGGRYVFATPHAFEGPFDVSRVFGSDRAEGMHLKEYTYRELHAALRKAGFTRIAAVFRLPRRLRSRFGGKPLPVPSRAYCRYLSAVERVIAPLPRRTRRQAARALRAALWTSGVTLVGLKRDESPSEIPLPRYARTTRRTNERRSATHPLVDLLDAVRFSVSRNGDGGSHAHAGSRRHADSAASGRYPRQGSLRVPLTASSAATETRSTQIRVACAPS